MLRHFLCRAFTRMSALAGIHALDQNFKAAIDVHDHNPRDVRRLVEAQVKLESEIPFIFDPQGAPNNPLRKSHPPTALEDLERAKALARWISEAGQIRKKSGYVYPFALYLRVISQVAEGSARTGHEMMHAVASQAYAELLLISAHPDKNKRDPMGERSIEHYMNDLQDVWSAASRYPGHRDMMRTRLLRNAAQLDSWDCWPGGRPNLRSRVYDYREELLQLIDPYDPALRL